MSVKSSALLKTLQSHLIHASILPLYFSLLLISGFGVENAFADPGIPDLQAASDSGSSNTDNNTNDNTPTFDIACDGTSTVQLKEGAATLASGTCSGGTIALTSSALTDGTHNVFSREPSFPDSATLAVVIDTTNPAAPGTPNMQAASDTGSSSTDENTSDNTPTFDITCTSGLTVQLRTGTTVLGTGTCAGGTVAITSSTLADGNYNVNARQIDVAGNTGGNSGSLGITIDTTAPTAPGTPNLNTASDTGTSNTDDITSDSTPTFTIGSCNNGDPVRVYANAVLVGSGTCTGTTATITTSTLSDNTYSVTATRLDTAGNESVFSSGLTVVIDTAGPAAASVPDLDAASDTGTSSTDDNTSDNTPTFTITGCENGATVQLREGGTTLGTATCSGGTASVTSSTLSQGTHNIASRQVDVAGNTGTTSGTLAVVIDTTAPAAPGTPDLDAASDSGASSVDNNTNITTPTFTITCISGTTVQLRESTTVLGTATCVSSSASITSSLLSDGAHIVNARQLDVAGNASVNSGNLTVTIDTAPPAAPSTPDLDAASDTGVSSTDNNTSDSTPTFTISCTTGTTVSLIENAGSVASGTCSGGTISLTSPSVADGSHSFTASQTDLAGNTGSESSALVIVVDTTISSSGTPDLQDASDSGSSITDDITSVSTPTFDITCNSGDTVTLLDGVSVVASGPCPGTSISLTSSALSDGAHSMTSVQSDTAGNTAAASSALVITVDTTEAATGTPDLQTASDSGVSNADEITNVASPTFDISCDSGASVELFEGVNSLGTGTCAGGTVSITTTSPLADGVYSIGSRQTDAAGNVSVDSATLSVTIDTDAPAVPSTPDLRPASDSGTSNSDDLTNETTPDFLVECSEDGNEVALVLGGGPLPTVIGTGVCSGGTVLITSGTILADGINDISAHETDIAGNVSSESSFLSVTIDTTEDPTGTPDLVSGDDTGTSSTDDITSVTTPTFDISCAAGDSVELFEGVNSLATGICDVGGTISLTSSALFDGTYSIGSRQTDAAGNTSADSSLLSVTIDTSAPSTTGVPDLQAGSDSGVSSTDDITNVSTPTLDVTCSEDGNTVELVAAAVVIGSGTCSSGTVSITTSALDDGTYAISSHETDTAGNTSVDSATLSVVIDTQEAAPGAPDLVASDDSGTSNTDNLTNVTTPGFDISCNVNDYVELREGATVLAFGTCTGTSINLVSSALSEGDHTVNARQTDLAGNVSLDSADLTVTVDTTAPADSGTPDLQSGSDTGSSNTDDITSETQPTVDVTCTADGDTVEVLEGASVLGTGTCSGGTVAITLTSPLSEGGHLIFSHETDAAGNTSGDSGNLSLTIDTTAPGTPGAPDLQAASDSGSSSTDNVTNDTTPTFDGTCASDGDTVELVTGTTVLGSSTCSGGTVTITSSVLANGVQVVFLRETDTSGNTSSNSSTLSVTIDASTPALTGPPDLVAGSDTGASAADNVTGDNTPTFILTCETGTSVVLFDGVTSVGTSTCAGGTVSITASVLSDGSHSITAKQTDLAGNTSNGSAVLGVTIDTAAPAAPSITAPTNGSTVESNAPAISGSGEIGGTVSIFDGATLLGTATVNGSGAWTFTPSPDLADGSHSLTATETDLAGNTSASSGAISFIIDAGAFISSPGFIKWNTFLKQWNFLELVASGSGGFNVTIDIYNLNSVKIFSDTVFLGGNSEYDYDINNAIFTACASATPPAGCTGLTDVDGDGLLDSYGTIVLRFTPPTGSHLVGRMTNYRPDTNANSFSFAFPRELRKTSKGKTFAVANTYDPQNSGFLVPNFGELIHIGEAQAAATGGVVAGGRYTVNIYDQVGTLVNTQRIPADNSPAIQALGEVDFAAGHQIVNPQTGQPIEAVYLVEVVPDDLNAEYLFSVARYSSNAPAGTVPTSYNYALAVAGRAPATDVLYAPITNETFSCGIPQTWVEVANTSGTAQTANVTFRNSAGTVVGTATGTSFPAKGQIHFNGTGVLTAGDIGSVSVQSTNPGTFIVQSMNYIHSCNENLIDSAYVSLGRTVGRQVQLGTVNTFLAMTDTIRSISTVGSSNTLGMTFKPFGGSAITTSRPIAAFGSDSLVINSLGFPSDQYGSAQVDGGATHTFLADILRSRTQTRGGQSHVDFIVPSEVR